MNLSKEPLLKLMSLSDIKKNIGRGTSYIWTSDFTNMRVIAIIPTSIVAINFTIKLVICNQILRYVVTTVEGSTVVRDAI